MESIIQRKRRRAVKPDHRQDRDTASSSASPITSGVEGGQDSRVEMPPGVVGDHAPSQSARTALDTALAPALHLMTDTESTPQILSDFGPSLPARTGSSMGFRTPDTPFGQETNSDDLFGWLFNNTAQPPDHATVSEANPPSTSDPAIYVDAFQLAMPDSSNATIDPLPAGFVSDSAPLGHSSSSTL